MTSRALAPSVVFVGELLTWKLATSVFLALYVLKWSGSAKSVVPHILIVGVALGCLWALRLLAWTALPGGIARIAGSLVTALCFLLLLSYYALMFVGLVNWGRLVTWPLVAAYLPQIGNLLQVLDLTPWLVVILVLLLLLLLIFVVDFVLVRRDWVRVVASRLSIALALSTSLGGIGFAAVYFARLSLVPPVHLGEPFSLTFASERIYEIFQENTLTRSPALDSIERAAASAYQINPEANRKNVVFIVVDALRPDRMSLYGSSRKTTPFLDSMDGLGRLHKVNGMRSVCTESYCGLLGMARSKFVHEFSRQSITLHEVLRRHGYAVKMILGGDHSNFYGLREAYGRTDHYVDASVSRSHYLNDDHFVIEQIEQLPLWDGTPVYLQLHLMSAHGLGWRHPESQIWNPAGSYYSPSRSSDSTLAVNYYDNGVFQTDEMIRRALALLNVKGYLAAALVVITADHGEMLGERGLYQHSHNIWEPAVQVPFVLLTYGEGLSSNLQVPRISSVVDIAPTILHDLQMPIPERWMGRPLQLPITRDFVYVQQAVHVGLYFVDLKERVTKFGINLRSGEEWAYDLTADPGESVNIITSMDSSVRSRLRVATIASSSSVVVRDELVSSD